MAVDAPSVPILSNLRAPDGRPAVQIFKGHPYYTEVDPTLKKGQAGPGMFVSRKDPQTGELRLYAALVPVTRVQRDPVNMERTIDVPLTDEQGRVLMQLDPAARATIQLMADGDEEAKSMPTTPFPDTKDPLSNSVEQLKTVIIEQNAAAEARMAHLITALVGALKERH